MFIVMAWVNPLLMDDILAVNVEIDTVWDNDLTNDDTLLIRVDVVRLWVIVLEKLATLWKAPVIVRYTLATLSYNVAVATEMEDAKVKGWEKERIRPDILPVKLVIENVLLNGLRRLDVLGINEVNWKEFIEVLTKAPARPDEDEKVKPCDI